MQQSQEGFEATERVDRDAIVLDDDGKFPRTVVIVKRGKKVAEYRFIKTRRGGYALNK